MAKHRARWRVWQVGREASRLIFIDETGVRTNLTRQHGWARRGKRLLGWVPQSHWKTITLIAALDVKGVRCAMTLEGAVDRDAFEAFIGQVLVPTLRKGDIVVMDNLSSHKGGALISQITSVGATVSYLPAYSPDFNPIEMAFSKLKQALRSAAYRDGAALESNMQLHLDSISAQDARHYFRHCGYPL